MAEAPEVKEIVERVMVEDTMEIVAPQGWREKVRAALEAKAKSEGYEVLPESFVARRASRDLEELEVPDQSPWEAVIKVYKA